MVNVIERRDVLLGNENYEYIRTKKGEEQLSKIENIGKQEISVILKNVSKGNSKEIEDYIINVLSDLYIQRNVKKLT
ncbi:MAG: hypothetical protein HFJ26_01555 [Clostridia bacterium]|nr:hypothetical protein [Clostridia bacterium]